MRKRVDRRAYKAVVRCLNDLENGRAHRGENGDIAPWQDNLEYFRWLKHDYEHLMALENQNKDRAMIAVLLIAFVCALTFSLWTL